MAADTALDALITSLGDEITLLQGLPSDQSLTPSHVTHVLEVMQSTLVRIQALVEA